MMANNIAAPPSEVSSIQRTMPGFCPCRASVGLRSVFMVGLLPHPLIHALIRCDPVGSLSTGRKLLYFD